MNHISSCPSLGLYALVVKNPHANAGDIRDAGSTPGLGRSPGGEHGNTLQYSCLENRMDRRAWLSMVHRVAKSQTWLKPLSTHVSVAAGTILGTRSLAHQERGEGLGGVFKPGVDGFGLISLYRSFLSPLDHDCLASPGANRRALPQKQMHVHRKFQTPWSPSTNLNFENPRNLPLHIFFFFKWHF